MAVPSKDRGSNLSEMRHRRSEVEKRLYQAERIDKHGAQLCVVSGVGAGAIATVDVQPVFRRNFTQPFGEVDAERGPVIPGVVYGYPGGTSSVWVPPSVGMFGLLVQTEHEIREWIASGGSADITTRETRRNDRSSGVFFPIGGGSFDDRVHVVGSQGVNIVGNGCDLLEEIAAGFDSLNRPNVAAEIRTVRG